MDDAPQLIPNTAENVARLGARLQAGDLVAFPTETVYGLGADATNDRAVARIFDAKGRPSFNPLIVHLAPDMDPTSLVKLTPLAEKLMAAFWPGPLTLVLERQAECPLSALVSAGLQTAAIRMPAHPLAQTLLQASGRPIAAPSANRSGSLSPTTPEHVLESFKDTPLASQIHVLDGGRCAVGLESTVVLATGERPVLLRAGGITADQLRGVTGDLVIADPTNDQSPASPGMLSKHYAPSRPLRLNVHSPEASDLLIGFGDIADDPSFNLSATGDLTEAAANLFALLHAADRRAPNRIAVAPIPNQGLGVAINDRLSRATKV